jgi:hypothetical protein
MKSYRYPEIFYTFIIDALIAFLRKKDPALLQAQLAHIDVSSDKLRELDGSLLSRREWLGTAERMVFDSFRRCAPFVSPFSIHKSGRLALLADPLCEFLQGAAGLQKHPS